MGKGLRDKGNYYRKKSSFNEEIDYYNQSKVIGEEIEDKSLIAGTSFNLGTVYLKNKDNPISAISKRNICNCSLHDYGMFEAGRDLNLRVTLLY